MVKITRDSSLPVYPLKANNKRIYSETCCILEMKLNNSMTLRMGLSGNGQLSDSTRRFGFGFDLILFCYFKAC